MDETRDWIFTFCGDSPWRRRFVRIHGTRAAARAKMFARFGREWGFQYKSEDDAGVAKYGLVEIDFITCIDKGA